MKLNPFVVLPITRGKDVGCKALVRGVGVLHLQRGLETAEGDSG